jgi:hypothetical protein
MAEPLEFVYHHSPIRTSGTWFTFRYRILRKTPRRIYVARHFEGTFGVERPGYHRYGDTWKPYQMALDRATLEGGGEVWYRHGDGPFVLNPDPPTPSPGWGVLRAQ